MSNTNITTTTETTTVVVEENIVRIELNNIGVQGVPGANTDPTYVTVRNATGATLAKGTIVYISGANGNHVQVTPAIATSDATSARTLGWLSAAIANNASGLCMVEGYLEGINTQSFNAGDQLYLSGTTAGGFTATKPQAPIHLVYVGVVTKKSAGDGHVFVKVQNGYELEELHNVQIINPTNNQVLAYDSATSLWKNATNAPDGVTSITATAPLTGGTITSTGSIGLDQTALSITKSQVSDFTSGTVTSASTAQQAGTALFATNASTAVFATTAGTSTTISGTITKSQVSDFTSGTVASASTAQQSGTAVYAVNSGTAVYSTTSGTAVYSANSGTAVTISGTITKSQVSDFTSGTVTQADNATTSGFATTSGTAVFATTSGTALTISGDITRSQVSDFTSGTVASAGTAQQAGTAVFATNASTAVSVSGSAITQSQVVNLTTDLAGKANLAGGNSFTGAQTVTSTAIGQIPLTITGATGQTGNLFSVRSDASELAFFSAAGNLNVFQQVRVGGSSGLGQLSVTSINASNIGLVVRGASGQSTDLIRIQNSGALTNFSVSQFGRTNMNGSMFVTPVAASEVVATVRGFASQSANLLELQTSAGSILSRFDSNANLFNTNRVFVGTNTFQFNTLFVQAVGGTTETTAVIRANTGLTGNLQEWQNSAGTVQARVNASGIILGVSLRTAQQWVQLKEENSGGALSLTKMTSAAGNDGAGVGRIYFRDGTNAGTLKLVVRAGAAGAETTILDNIPQ